MSLWKHLSIEQIRSRVFQALQENINFYDQGILGVPASHLDGKVFPQDMPFLKEAPFLSTLIHNPNHIGCHTLGESEAFFQGTQELEREVIHICAQDILKGEAGQHDGYVAAGGTEANIQALWIYRNYFFRKLNARTKEILVLCSEDSHYSIAKGADLLQLDLHQARVTPNDRQVDPIQLRVDLEYWKSKGKKYIIAVVNMMTTMFGSVDQPETYLEVMDDLEFSYKMHADGAYGGFIYPFSNQDNPLNFEHPAITSVTLDAHKMVQAPYGTGIFVIRKNWMQYTLTESAAYVKGLDATLSGSRSGANAVAVWMILSTYGPHGWFEKIQILQLRTNWLERQLKEVEVPYFREPYSNIITLQADYLPAATAEKFGLVPDDHHQPNWYKIVVMDHVTVDKLEPLIQSLRSKVVH